MKSKTSWNLKLLYKSDTDPQIEKDLKTIEQACAGFEREYRNISFTDSPENLAVALGSYEEVENKLNGSKPWWYFALKSSLDKSDTKVGAKATKNEQRITEAVNRIKFFPLAIAKIPEKEQKRFLNHSDLKSRAYFLQNIFKRAKFNLSEGEEQLEDLLSQTSYTMWVDAQERLLNKQTVSHKGKDIPIVKAMSELREMPKADRRAVYEKSIAVMKSISDLSEGEINAVYNYKKIMDNRRGRPNPHSSTVMGFENDEKAIDGLVSLVTKRFPVAHRFYKLHAKIIGEKKLHMADRNINMGKIKATFDFNASVSILRSILARLDKEYVEIFDSFLENGQIDVYPKKGKEGGAYCWGQGMLPTFVLLNHVNNVYSLKTLAHEIGHAIHNELSKRQPIQYRKYSTATAEVASTFFEQIVSEEIEKHLSEKEKIILLHEQLLGDISTIFRQIACFNFELELHKKIRSAGQLSKEDIAALLVQHLKSYLGDAVEVKGDDGYFYVVWTHIRRFFYVYTYAYGQIISRALYEKWKEDPSYGAKVKQFLTSGRSMSPEDIFKSIGIDTSKPSFFEAGIKGIEKDIDRLEKLFNASSRQKSR